MELSQEKLDEVTAVKMTGKLLQSVFFEKISHAGYFSGENWAGPLFGELFFQSHWDFKHLKTVGLLMYMFLKLYEEEGAIGER